MSLFSNVIFSLQGEQQQEGGLLKGIFSWKNAECNSFIQFKKPCIDCKIARIVVRLAARQHFMSKILLSWILWNQLQTKVANFTSDALHVYTWLQLLQSPKVSIRETTLLLDLPPSSCYTKQPTYRYTPPRQLPGLKFVYGQPEAWFHLPDNFRFTIPPTVDKMSNNKFDALGSDDSEGEGDPGQTLVEVRLV